MFGEKHEVRNVKARRDRAIIALRSLNPCSLYVIYA